MPVLLHPSLPLFFVPDGRNRPLAITRLPAAMSQLVNKRKLGDVRAGVHVRSYVKRRLEIAVEPGVAEIEDLLRRGEATTNVAYTQRWGV